jgi:hypothetical protein
MTLIMYILRSIGADPGFQVRGAHLKKLRRAEGGAKIVGVRAGCALPPGSAPGTIIQKLINIDRRKLVEIKILNCYTFMYI